MRRGIINPFSCLKKACSIGYLVGEEKSAIVGTVVDPLRLNVFPAQEDVFLGWSVHNVMSDARGGFRLAGQTSGPGDISSKAPDNKLQRLPGDFACQEEIAILEQGCIFIR